MMRAICDFGRVTQYRQRKFAGEIHGELVAQIGKSGMHFGGVRTRFGTIAGIVGPQFNLGMALCQRLADRQAVPDGDGLPAFFDFEYRHAPGRRAFEHLLGTRIAAQ